MQTSTERPIAAALPAHFDECMDEPTLDCTICGRPAVLEYRLERLDDAAEWRRERVWRACINHQDHYDVRASWLASCDRMIVQRCA